MTDIVDHLDSSKDLPEAVHISIGAASVCWEGDGPHGVFDSDRALHIAHELMHYIVSHFDSILQPNRSKGEKIVAECLVSNEPFFVFRARDILSTLVLRRYLTALEEIGPDDPDMHAGVVDFIDIMRKWQARHIKDVRYPD